MTVSLIKSCATEEQIAEARRWIADAYPAAPWDDDVHPVFDRSAAYVQRYTDRRYPGGWTAFVADCCVYA